MADKSRFEVGEPALRGSSYILYDAKVERPDGMAQPVSLWVPLHPSLGDDLPTISALLTVMNHPGAPFGSPHSIEGIPSMVMPPLKGIHLHHVLSADEPLSARTALEVGAHVADILQACEAEDEPRLAFGLNASEVMITTTGQVILMGFGLQVRGSTDRQSALEGLLSVLLEMGATPGEANASLPSIFQQSDFEQIGEALRARASELSGDSLVEWAKRVVPALAAQEDENPFAGPFAPFAILNGTAILTSRLEPIPENFEDDAQPFQSLPTLVPTAPMNLAELREMLEQDGEDNTDEPAQDGDDSPFPSSFKEEPEPFRSLPTLVPGAPTPVLPEALSTWEPEASEVPEELKNLMEQAKSEENPTPITEASAIPLQFDDDDDLDEEERPTEALVRPEEILAAIRAERVRKEGKSGDTTQSIDLSTRPAVGGADAVPDPSLFPVDDLSSGLLPEEELVLPDEEVESAPVSTALPDPTPRNSVDPQQQPAHVGPPVSRESEEEASSEDAEDVEDAPTSSEETPSSLQAETPDPVAEEPAPQGPPDLPTEPTPVAGEPTATPPAPESDASPSNQPVENDAPAPEPSPAPAPVRKRKKQKSPSIWPWLMMLGLMMGMLVALVVAVIIGVSIL